MLKAITELPNPLLCFGSSLPLFYDKAATVAMMKQGISVMKKATEFLNPSQIPVTICDQPFLLSQKSFSGTGLPQAEKMFTLSCWRAYTLRCARVKESVAAVGLTESLSHLEDGWWPDQKLLECCKSSKVSWKMKQMLMKRTNTTNKDSPHTHTKKTFQSHVKQLVSTILEMENPYKDDLPWILALDTRNCADALVVDTVHRVQELGLRQHKILEKDVIDQRTVSIHDTISKTFLPLLKRHQPEQISKASLSLTA